MLSIIVPSRGRPNELFTSLDSLELAKNELEALVWLDYDDKKIERYQQLFASNPNIKLFIKERVGYKKFHLMLNYLAFHSSFDWVLEWNDDACMINPDWFKIFRQFVEQFEPTNQPIVINIWGQGKIINNLFPIVSRAYLEILGHFSLTPNCDDWVRMVAIGANISYNLNGIQPQHRKYGADNPLKDGTLHETERDRREIKKGWNEKRQILPKQLLDADINKIIQHKNGQQTQN